MPGRSFILLMTALVVGVFLPLRTSLSLAALAGHPPIALGAYINDKELGGNAPCAAQAIDKFAGLVGRMPAIIMMEQSWAEHYNEFAARCLTYVVNRHATPMVAWFSGGTSAAEPMYKDINIIKGRFDPYITQWALAAKAWGHPFFLRFDAEMNGNWAAWGGGPNDPNGNSPAQFVVAWRHVHDIFVRVGATNAVWVWSPNDLSSHSPELAPFYPGDAYVDWIGIDGYNDGTNLKAGYSGWISFTKLFAAAYTKLAALTKKPMMIGEMASAEAGGNKGEWIKDTFLAVIPQNFPRIRAVIWFNEGGKVDWRVNSSKRSLAAYRRVVASPTYDGVLACSSIGHTGTQ